MTTEQVAPLMRPIMGGIGLAFFLVGLIVYIYEKRKTANCKAETSGIVIAYNFTGGAPLPVVEYQVDGRAYREKHYCYQVITIKKEGQPRAESSGARDVYMDENCAMHVRRDPSINYVEAAERLWKPGSALPVYYNPKKPDQAYVGRKPWKFPVMSRTFMITGTAVALLGLAVSPMATL